MIRISLDSLRQALSAGPRPACDALPALDYPLAAPPRVAVLGLELRPETGIHSLPNWTVPHLSRLRPMALAGAWADLAAVARLMRAGHLRLPELNYPLVVFSAPGATPLSEERHSQLWDWFGLPVFEQVRGAGGRLLAAECECREGFHLAEGRDPLELGAQAVGGRCPCGSAQPLYRLAAARALAAAGD